MSIRERAKKLDKILFDLFKCQWQQQHLFSEVSNLNIKELFTIQILGIKNDSATMSELADVFSIPATTMTSIVDRLVNKEYLTRFRSKKDRRIVKVSLSPKGREIYEQQYNLLLESKMTVLKILSKEEQQDLISLMEKVLINFKNQLK
ncbi:MarR family transcriptional regulator [Iocasia frigidifontis]|uniref:MarR family transcriptional regulator n=1 Tax=Iocasia fonsfrigidae TaxID=2682810 RepID=A0A8A7KE99_9FIRM|nr:MarR family transcriptional regulator [Iocasia fonsfrigidae]